MLDLALAGKVLGFFAHPDDETLGAGGTISRLRRSGVECHLAIASTGVTSRLPLNATNEIEGLRQDCYHAAGILGVEPERIRFGAFPDNRMDQHDLLDLIQWFEEIVSEVKPDVIVTHHRFCTNIDHRYCHEAAIVATRPEPGRHITLLSTEVPSSTGYLRPTHFEPNVYSVLETIDLEAKIDAINAYETEKRNDPHPRSPEVLRALAKVRGSEIGAPLAEGFMLVRGRA